MPHQVCYGGVRLLGEGPSLRNIARLDAGAVPMTHAMMSRGLQIDPSHFERMAKVLTEDMERVSEEVRAIAGHYLNLGSGDQVSQFLFKELGLKQPRPKFTASGKRESVEKEILVSLQHEHEAVGKIIEFKQLEKLRGTYAIPIPKLATRVGHGIWRLFPNIKMTRVPSSGRFSADEPNLLAMPNRTQRGRELCGGFITAPGWVYLSVDLSQIEPRTVAHRSEDPKFMAVYHNKEDIYSDFAIGAFTLPDKRYQDAEGWHYPGVDKKEHRFPSKTCTLASIYRVTAKGLVEQMPVVCANCGVEVKDHTRETCPMGFRALWQEDNCQDLINSFYLRYARIPNMQRMDDARARRYAYIWDDWGRLLHMQSVRSVHPWVVSASLREAGNMPIQGFAGGVFKLGMAESFDTLVQAQYYRDVWYPLLPIHDEILSECREDMAEEIGEHIADVFRNTVRLRVPLDADYASAATWGGIVK
jgi:DNA polymerase-1